jgi:hypothetical protein
MPPVGSTRESAHFPTTVQEVLAMFAQDVVASFAWVCAILDERGL